MKQIFLTVAILASLLSACNNEDATSSATRDTTTPQPTAPVTSPFADTASQTTVNPVATPIPVQSGIQPAPTNQAQTPGKTVGLNPAHGQPGHRCDIAVGAPLDSKPGTGMQNNLPTKQVAPQAMPVPTQSPIPAPSGQTAGLNPAHGQPGHRCDIAVGAPLK